MAVEVEKIRTHPTLWDGKVLGLAPDAFCVISERDVTGNRAKFSCDLQEWDACVA